LGGIVLKYNFLNYESRYYNFHNTQLLIYTDSTVLETSWDHNLIFCIHFLWSPTVSVLFRGNKRFSLSSTAVYRHN